MMRICGRFTYLENHTFANLEKMYTWSLDKELLSIEAGNINNIKNSIDEYYEQIMRSYIENNHESNTSYCHFGIHNSLNNDLIGYIDFQDINPVELIAELSLSIPDKRNRNRAYGFDAFVTALKYAFEIRCLKKILIRTRTSNISILNMSNRIGIDGVKGFINQNNESIEVIEFRIGLNEYGRIRNLTTASTG